MRTFVAGLLAGILLCARSTPSWAAGDTAVPDDTAQPSFAFYYGAAPLPSAELAAFDNVVVEPDSGFDPAHAVAPHTDWLAYASVGEVTHHRTYFSAIPKQWLIGGNQDWGSAVVDQAAPGWPVFFVEHVITPLWQRGYRGFFLDTLDSFQLIAKTDAERQRQENGLVAVIRAIKARYPDVRLVFNRGFEILPQVHSLVYAVSFESLFRGWNQGAGRFVEVAPADRDWLMAQVKTIREQYKLPVVAIDYCAPQDRACARDTAARIRALGVIPYVTDPALASIGVGAIEVMPRRILLIQDPPPRNSLNVSDGVRYITMPLNYLGYQVDYLNVNSEPLPTQVLGDRYAGVVLLLDNEVKDPESLRHWVLTQVQAGVPLAFINGFGMSIGGRFAQSLGLSAVSGAPAGALKVESVDSGMMGFEMPPMPDPRDYHPLQVLPGSRSLLRLKAGSFEIDAAALTPWGGYVMRPFGVFPMDAQNQARWVVQPFEFLRQALRLPAMPATDTTTENGRRLFMSHIDGDGFASKIEFANAAGDQFPGEALYRVIKRYGLPVDASVIEGEVSDEGPQAKIAPQLRAMARRLFALPNVEMASHTYTHPLPWLRVTGQGDSTSAYAEGDSQTADLAQGLAIKVVGYKFNLDREIGGSVIGITQKMAPPGKQVKVLLWSGDCQVPGIALKAAYQAGVMNLNGGDTLITKSYPSLTAVAPLGVMKGGYFQVFAPNQNEELYTQEWQGPYYGFRRVLETFSMTDTPRRLKPIDVYYHMFSATKQASLKAVEDVYQATARMVINPIFVSEYAHKVLDSQESASVARDGDYWQVRSAGALRTFRLAPGWAPDLSDAVGVAGFLPGVDGVYLHLSDDQARFRLIPLTQPQPLPYLASANGRIANFVRSTHGMSFDLSAHVAPQFDIAAPGICRVRVDQREIDASGHDVVAHYSLGPAGVPVSTTEQRVHVDVDCRS